MNICNWVAIHGFNSPLEYQRFCDWLELQIQSFMADEIPVRPLQTTIPFGFKEKCYRCKVSGDVWRLVAPEFPFRGLWDIVENYSDVLEENRKFGSESNKLDSDEMMSLNVIFHHIEAQIGIKFASEFYVFIDQFSKQAMNPRFNNFFNKFRFCSEKDVRTAIENFIPEDFMPFFVDEHDGFDDYYCFERLNIDDRNRVIVFSQDAVVFEWACYSDFLIWVQDQIDLCTS